MRTLLLVVALAALASPATASAYGIFYSGNELYRLSTGDASSKAQFKGYVAGFMDNKRGLFLCPRESTHLEQLAQKVREILSNSPGERHKPAAHILTDSLSKCTVEDIGDSSHNEHFFDGNDLYRLIKSEGAESATAFGYIAGHYDGSAWLNQDNEIGQRPMCVPENVTLRQIHDVVMKYLREHPSKRHNVGNAVVGTAIMDAFPCE